MNPVWTRIALVALGGALGAVGRYGVSSLAVRWVQHPALGTFAANVLGCLALGFAKAALDAAGIGSPEARLFLFTGFLGAFTTFATFEADFFALAGQFDRLHAAAYVVGSVACGGLAFLAGSWLGQRWP